METINKNQIKVYLDNLGDAVLSGDREKAFEIAAFLKKKRFNLLEVL